MSGGVPRPVRHEEALIGHEDARGMAYRCQTTRFMMMPASSSMSANPFASRILRMPRLCRLTVVVTRLAHCSRDQAIRRWSSRVP